MCSEAYYMRHRSLICDRSLLTRLAYKLTVDTISDVVEDASSVEAAIDAIKRVSPNLILLSLNLHGLGDLGLLDTFLEHTSNSKVLLVCETYFATKHYHKLTRSGIAGICLEESGFDAIPSAFTAIASGKTFCDPILFKFVQQRITSDTYGLSAREIDILIRLDLRNIDISDELSIKLPKLENQIGKVLAKLQVETRSEASQKARDLGLHLLPVFPSDMSGGGISKTTPAELRATKVISAWCGTSHNNE